MNTLISFIKSLFSSKPNIENYEALPMRGVFGEYVTCLSITTNAGEEAHYQVRATLGFYIVGYYEHNMFTPVFRYRPERIEAEYTEIELLKDALIYYHEGLETPENLKKVF